MAELQLRQQNLPEPRYGHGMVNTGPTSNEFYIFGGVVSSSGKRCNQTWKFNI